MNRKKRIIWQLYPSYLVITLVSLLAVSWYTIDSVKSFCLDRTEDDLRIQAELMKKQILGNLSPVNAARIDQLCKQAAGTTVTRLTVILKNGQVVGDSEKSPPLMDNHRDRPEVIDALAEGMGSSVRYSGTLKQHMMYVAIPLKVEGEIVGTLRASLPITAIDNELNAIQMRIALAGLVIALLASLVCYYISKRISRPIEEMKKGVEQFARGDLKHRLRPPDTLELASLAESMNEVAIQLENRIETVVTQRNEYQAVLTSMVEGVVAIDMNEVILSLNRPAAAILNLGTIDYKGRSLQEITRNRDLHKFVEETLSSGKLAEGDIVFFNEEEHIVHTQSIPLRDANEKRIGTLLVLNDVTQLRHLENVRRDFVANVSHEIKTPLTAIKGFVETLLHGQVDKPEDGRRFLEIVNKHVDRLNAIVEDLLSLARIEQQDEKNEILLEEKNIRRVIESAVQVVQSKAQEKNITIGLECEPDLRAMVDHILIDQALVNLLDNAVKYSPEFSEVRVSTVEEEAWLRIDIRDNGPGINKKHLPRLFERFYRVDKARSRTLGGTGLGLAIVKHIAKAHGGNISVESTLGKGSTFTIRLPKRFSGNP